MGTFSLFKSNVVVDVAAIVVVVAAVVFNEVYLKKMFDSKSMNH